MTALAKATVETEVVHKEDSLEETETDGGSGETKEVDLSAVAKQQQKLNQFTKKIQQRKQT